jgi:two-component system, response regulator, stage 0 sporulation protein F
MQRQRVLVVEDQREIARMLRSAIQLLNPALEVLDTLSAEEASLELTERGADLLIVDVRLPGISGLQLIERWQKQNLHVPFIITTGFADPVTRGQAERLGAKAFFAKPLPMVEFLEAVRAVLSGEEYRPGEDRAGRILTELRQACHAEAAWLCQESGQVALRAGDVLDAEEYEIETVLQSAYLVQRKAASLLGGLKESAPSQFLMNGTKRSLLISPLPSGAMVLLFFSHDADTAALRVPLAHAVAQLEELFRIAPPPTESGVLPMPDWVQLQTVPQTGELHLEHAARPVEPTEAKSFWDEASLAATGFLSPGKLSFEEAERLGLAPGGKPSDPYRVLK